MKRKGKNLLRQVIFCLCICGAAAAGFYPAGEALGEGLRLPPEELLVGYITASYAQKDESWIRLAEPGTEILSPGEEKAFVEEYTDGDGTRYRLSGKTPVGEVLTADIRSVARQVEYQKVEFPEEIPKQIGVEIWDGDREAVGRGVLTLQSWEPVLGPDGNPKTEWLEDFSMVVTFRAYGAETYELNGKRIRHREDVPPLAGSEGELLGLIGGKAENYRIDRIEWLGESYADPYGICYRNAIVRGSRRVGDYRAAYAGDVMFPAVLKTRYVGVYQAEEPDTQPETVPAPATPDSVVLPETGGAEAGSGQMSVEAEISGTPPETVSTLTLAERAGNAFVRAAEEAEEWFYRVTSVFIPWEALLAGMVLLGTGGVMVLRAFRRRGKKFL